RLVDPSVVRNGQDDPGHRRAASIEPKIHDLVDVGIGLQHPVVAGDPQIEVPVLYRPGNLLWPKDLHLADARIGYRGVVVAIGCPSHRQIGLFEQLQGVGFQAALREHQVDHRASPAPTSSSKKQVGWPVWQTGPAGSASISRVSLSQSIQTRFTRKTWPDVSPLVQSTWRSRLQKVTNPFSRVSDQASGFMNPTM